MPARLAVLGDGDRWLADALAAAAAQLPGRMSFTQGYDEGLAHRLFGAADLFLMPSRFEPCGLAQMQAMRYGALPIVTDVGGLHDTVVDVDADPSRGTGIVAARADPIEVLDALHRGVRAVVEPVPARRDAPAWACRPTGRGAHPRASTSRTTSASSLPARAVLTASRSRGRRE